MPSKYRNSIFFLYNGTTLLHIELAFRTQRPYNSALKENVRVRLLHIIDSGTFCWSFLLRSEKLLTYLEGIVFDTPYSGSPLPL